MLHKDPLGHNQRKPPGVGLQLYNPKRNKKEPTSHLSYLEAFFSSRAFPWQVAFKLVSTLGSFIGEVTILNG